MEARLVLFLVNRQEDRLAKLEVGFRNFADAPKTNSEIGIFPINSYEFRFMDPLVALYRLGEKSPYT
jgi:hypothetical protein